MHKKPGAEILYTKRPHTQKEPAHTRPRVYTKRGQTTEGKEPSQKEPRHTSNLAKQGPKQKEPTQTKL